MTKEELITKLNDLLSEHDAEKAHIKADELLLEYIDDMDIEVAYEAIEKWYS